MAAPRQMHVAEAVAGTRTDGAEAGDDSSAVRMEMQRIPISFAEFKLVRLLGKGAFGTVY